MRIALAAVLLAGRAAAGNVLPPSLPPEVNTVSVRLDYPSEAFAAYCDKFAAWMQAKAGEAAWRCSRHGKGDAQVTIHVDWSRDVQAAGRDRYVRLSDRPFGPGAGVDETYDSGSRIIRLDAAVSGSVAVAGGPPAPFKFQLSTDELGKGLRSELYDALLKRIAEKLAADLVAHRPALKLPKDRGTPWVRLPGGSFLMGGGAQSNANPRHLVLMAPFEISKSLATFGQYQKCVAAKACAPAHTLDGTCTVYDEHTGLWGPGTLPETFEGDDQPVVCVDWAQASAYSKWAGGRLPTEAEFEYAARAGGREQNFPWGNEAPSCDLTVMSVGVNGCQRKATRPVCSRAAGNTEQGLCDMTGNASEWVEDWYQDSYRGAAKDGSAQENPGTGRVLRGGSWSMDIAFAPARVRRAEPPETRNAAIGFRPARSAKGTIVP